MQASAKALELIKASESCAKLIGGGQVTSYKEEDDVWTIGYGTTLYPDGKKVAGGDVITVAQAVEYLELHVENIAKAISNMELELNQNQFDAIVDFVYNLGIGNFQSSTLLKLIKKNPNDIAIAREFEKWVYRAKKKLPGLVIRRKKESDLYFTGL